MNRRIRAAILAYIASNGATDTRKVISIMSKRFNTTRQRISGNISWLVRTSLTVGGERNTNSCYISIKLL